MSLELRPGTVHALLGENGASKSTLMRIAFGVINPDEGQIKIDGRPVNLRSPRAAIEAGMLGPARTISHSRAQTELRQDQPSNTPVIRLGNIDVKRRSSPKHLRNVNLDVNAGEIVGVAALDGAAGDLLRVIGGRDKPTAGKLITPFRVGFIPEDPQRDALIGDFSIFGLVDLAHRAVVIHNGSVTGIGRVAAAIGNALLGSSSFSQTES